MSVSSKGPGAWIEEIAANPSVADLQGNKTLFLESMTSDPPKAPKVEKIQSLKHAFETFQPKKGITFETADGSEVSEEFRPKAITDFGKEGIVKQSNFLADLNQKGQELQKIAQSLKSNKTFQKLLEDKEAKELYLAAINSLISELEKAEKK
jgi:hypothetical protein